KTGDPVYDTFIKRSLGTLLPDCIKQLAESRPADPIEFISNSLYKAVDSQLYKREKEKYLHACLQESALLQKEREERKARMDMLLQAHRDNKFTLGVPPRGLYRLFINLPLHVASG
ncbi:flagellar radial spoke protein 2-like, partial [Elysia marginata]